MSKQILGSKHNSLLPNLTDKLLELYFVIYLFFSK